jgi:hypothetical protein
MGASIGPPPSTPIGVLPHKDHLPLGQSDIGNGNPGQECDRQLALRMTANRKAVWDGELALLADSASSEPVGEMTLSSPYGPS